MASTGLDIQTFRGLMLRDDPEEVGTAAAVDLLDVELDSPGRIRTRDGFSNFTSVAGAAGYTDVASFYRTATTANQLLAGRGQFVDALDSSGAVVATLTGSAGTTNWGFVHYGGPSSEVIYCLELRLNGQGYKWDGSTFSAGIAAFGTQNGGAVQTRDNRLVLLDDVPIASKVKFSGAGTPEVFGANDYVQLVPGDGEGLQQAVSWRDLLFVFKRTKFFVFYGTSTSSTGSPIFDYRTADHGVGAVSQRAAVAGTDGVYFLARDGVYRTTGSVPEKISGALDPLFGRGVLPTAYSGSAINWAQISKASVGWVAGRLYVMVPTGSSTANDRTFVFDPATGQWTAWSTAMSSVTAFRVSSTDEPLFARAAGANHVGRMSAGSTTDAGAAISARYRFGFIDGPPSSRPDGRSRVHGVALDAAGGVTVKSAVDDSATLGTGVQAFPTSTYPTVVRQIDRRGIFGRNVSLEISGAAPWSVSRVRLPAFTR